MHSYASGTILAQNITLSFPKNLEANSFVFHPNLI
jgi:hypothetical protein